MHLLRGLRSLLMALPTRGLGSLARELLLGQSEVTGRIHLIQFGHVEQVDTRGGLVSRTCPWVRAEYITDARAHARRPWLRRTDMSEQLFPIDEVILAKYLSQRVASRSTRASFVEGRLVGTMA